MIVVGFVFINKYVSIKDDIKTNTESVTELTSVKESSSVRIITEPSTIASTKAHPSKKKPVPSTPAATEQPKQLWNKFKPICQYPELPTGCEITSLTMVLNYNGLSAKKGDLSDNYLDKGKVGTVDFRKAFEGDPRDGDSYGCYAPVIIKTANRYLKSHGSKLKAIEITGTDFDSLFDYTDVDIPVMVWCTYELKQGHYSLKWHVDGEDLTWYTPEHCMVLLGKRGNKAITADPASGEIKFYDKNLLKKRYNELYKQAVIIH